MASTSDYTRQPLPVWKAPPVTQQEVEWADIVRPPSLIYEYNFLTNQPITADN